MVCAALLSAGYYKDAWGRSDRIIVVNHWPILQPQKASPEPGDRRVGQPEAFGWPGILVT